MGSKFKDYNIIKVALFGSTTLVLIFFLASAPWQFLIIVPIFAGFNGLVQAILPAIVSKSADMSIQGEVLGVNSSIQALAQAVPPILSGLIAAKFSTDTPIIVAILVMFISSLLFLFLYKAQKPASATS